MFPMQKLQFTSFAQAKASEDLLKSHPEDSELLTLASYLLKKNYAHILEENFKHPISQLKKLINSVDTHFESFEKSAEVNVQNEFNAKRL